MFLNINAWRAHHDDLWWLSRSVGILQVSNSSHVLNDLSLAFVSIDFVDSSHELVFDTFDVDSILSDRILRDLVEFKLVVELGAISTSHHELPFHQITGHLIRYIEHEELVRDYLPLLQGYGLEPGPWESFENPSFAVFIFLTDIDLLFDKLDDYLVFDIGIVPSSLVDSLAEVRLLRDFLLDQITHRNALNGWASGILALLLSNLEVLLEHQSDVITLLFEIIGGVTASWALHSWGSYNANSNR